MSTQNLFDPDRLFPGDPPPVNALVQKWREKYPVEPCAGMSYSCMFCGRCPSGDYWKVPEEDKVEQAEWEKKFAAWAARHPEYPQILFEQEIEIMDPDDGKMAVRPCGGSWQYCDGNCGTCDVAGGLQASDRMAMGPQIGAV